MSVKSISQSIEAVSLPPSPLPPPPRYFLTLAIPHRFACFLSRPVRPRARPLLPACAGGCVVFDARTRSRNRKSMSVLCRTRGDRPHNRLFVKGAPEMLVNRCSKAREKNDVLCGFVIIVCEVFVIRALVPYRSICCVFFFIV